MPSKATTVDAYLASLPEDRRQVIAAVRKVFLKSLDNGYEEGMQYGMIGYYVPHRVYPAGYHCDPKQPLPFAGMASQKGHMSLYLMGVYGNPAEEKRLRDAWAKAGKKLDMGKACIRFKKLEDLPLEALEEIIRALPVKQYIAQYEAALERTATARTATSKPAAKKPKAKPAAAKSGKAPPKTSGRSAGSRKKATSRKKAAAR